MIQVHYLNSSTDKTQHVRDKKNKMAVTFALTELYSLFDIAGKQHSKQTNKQQQKKIIVPNQPLASFSVFVNSNRLNVKKRLRCD